MSLACTCSTLIPPVWAPFAGVRPISELRAGAYLIRER
jgi:hypothetical protein